MMIAYPGKRKRTIYQQRTLKNTSS